MYRLGRSVIVALAIGLLAPLVGADTTSPEPGKTPTKVTYTGAGAGILKKVDANSLTLQMDVPHLQRSGGSSRGRSRSSSSNVRLTVTHQDVNLPVDGNVVVRKAEIPSSFDSKGNIVTKHTPAELKELKGDTHLPGYKADRSDLRTGQIVEVFVGPDKDVAKGSPPKGEVVMILIIRDAQGTNQQPKK